MHSSRRVGISLLLFGFGWQSEEQQACCRLVETVGENTDIKKKIQNLQHLPFQSVDSGEYIQRISLAAFMFFRKLCFDLI